MIVIGLTGSIGMGKSTVAAMFAELGASVWCADDAVHRLYAEEGAGVGPVRELFPEVIVNGAVDRRELASVVLGAPDKLKQLEEIVHPLVGVDREEFLREAALAHAPAVVLDIPLLFENGSEKFFNAVVVVSAPPEVQRDRVLKRPGMSEQKLEAILSEQMPDAEKRQRADYVINTNQPIEATKRDVEKIYRQISQQTED